MGYRLADGSLSTDYKIGDLFIKVLGHGSVDENSIVEFKSDDGSERPLFKLKSGDSVFTEAESDGVYISWYFLKPYKTISIPKK